MFNRLDTIPACDRQTDGQTSCDTIVRAMHRRRDTSCGNKMMMIALVCGYAAVEYFC